MQERLIALMADGDDEAQRPTGGLTALRTLILAHTAVRTWAWVLPRAEVAPSAQVPVIFVFALAVTACAVLALVPRYARVAPVFVAGLLSIEIASSMPGTANHVVLEYIVVLLFALLDPGDDEEGPLLTAALRWVTVVVLFYTGLHKLWYGYYFQAEFLVWAMSVGEHFAGVFSWLLPPAEHARIQALDGFTAGTGPYRSGAVALVLASNAVYLLELALPVLLVRHRTRSAATVVAVAFVIAIQLGARETMFALLFSQLLLALPAGNWNRRAAPAFALAYLYLAAYLAGLVPGDFLTRGGLL